MDLECKYSVSEFNKEQLDLFDSVFAPHTVNSTWWKLLESAYSGIECMPLYGFFYDKNRSIIAILSAQYFPKISFSPYFNHDLLPISITEYLQNKPLSCLMVHAFTSVSSIWARDSYSPLELVDTFADKIQDTHTLNIILIRNLLYEQINSVVQGGTKIKNDWWFSSGQARFSSNFIGCGTLNDYLMNNLNSDNRRKVNASIKKLTDNPDVRILRINNYNQLMKYTSQLISLKISTYERNKSNLSIPLKEKNNFFEHCFELYGNENYLHLIVDKNDAVIGYSNAIAINSQARGISLGIKYPEGKVVDAWYNLMMRSYADFIDNGIKRVNLGLGHEHIKKRIGSKATELKTAIKFTDNTVDPGMEKILAQAMRPI